MDETRDTTFTMRAEPDLRRLRARILCAAVVVALACPAALMAQEAAAPPLPAPTYSSDANDPTRFPLDPQPTRAAGPADANGAVPVVTPTAAVPAPRLAPAPTQPARPVAIATPTPAAAKAAPLPPRPQPSTEATPEPQPAQPEATQAALPASQPAAPAAPAPSPSVAPPPLSSQWEGLNWREWPEWAVPALGGLALVIVGLILFAWQRRRARRPLALAPPQEPSFAPGPQPSPPAALPARPRQPVPAPAFAQSEPPAVAVLSLTLEATRMSATLMNAALAYRLRLTNRGAVPLADVDLSGDMISAHATRPMAEQLGEGAALGPLHGVAGLAPGESVVLGGELRLPLAAILPIRRGDAQLFVPLARFAVSAALPDGARATLHRAFLVGQTGSAKEGRLQPFRLDLGPRVYTGVGQRELA